MANLFEEPEGSAIAIAVLLLANAFFVAAEFALVKVRDLRLETFADKGNRSARLTLRIRRDLETYLAACQLGITMASLGLGWAGEPAVAALLEPLFTAFGISERSLHTVSFLAGFLMFSSLHFVVGEQVPKALAVRQPEPISLAVAYPLHIFYLLCYPLTSLLNWASGVILSPLGIAKSSEAELLLTEEFGVLSDVSTEHGELERERTAMLYSLFPFDDRPVKRAMVPRREVVYLRFGAPPAETLRLITETTHSRLPLVEGDWENLIGVVLVQEVLTAALKGNDAFGKIQSFARKPLMIPESERVARLFEAMRAKRAHLAFVLDEYGEFVGLVTLEDLLDEVVGGIAEELSDEEGVFGIRFVDPGWEAHGLAPLADVRRVTGFSLGPVDANTLSGFFMQRCQRMPAVGDRWEENGFQLTVKDVRQRHVQLCELVKLPE